MGAWLVQKIYGEDVAKRVAKNGEIMALPDTI
jgi:hypothetical protein